MGRSAKWDDRWSWCRKLNSLAAESVIITLIIIHVLSSAFELLIHFEIIQVPGDKSSSESSTSQSSTSPITTISTTPKSSSESSECDPLPHHDDLILTVDILRYVCVVISALFIVEMTCKIVYLQKDFFRDLWQVFDLVIAICSFAIELAFLVRHDSLLCIHPATQVATFVIVLRLWRIPRVCNIQKEEYSVRLDSHIEHLTKTKVETDNRCRHLEVLYQQQEQEIKHLRTVLKEANIEIEEETNYRENIPNGKGPVNGVINKLFHGHEDAADVHMTGNGHVTKETVLLEVDKAKNRNADNSHSDLERNDSDVNSKANDSGIEVKDSFRSDITGNSAPSVKVATEHIDEVFDDSDTELSNAKEAIVQEVEVQIEEPSRQNQLPSITSNNRSFDDTGEDVVLREKNSKLTPYYVNDAYDADDDMDGTKTYRSADGIPTTEL